MDTRTLRVLEFPKILELLAAEASTTLGAAACRALRPRSDPGWIERRLEETSEARALLGRLGTPPFGGLTDVRAVLERARKGGGLAEEELLAVADAAAALTRLRDYYSRGQENAPRLWAMAQRLGDYSELEAAIRAVIDDEGQVRPDASPELARLHREVHRAEETLRSRMEAILRREMSRGTLQEPVIVQRAGRWCLAVQAGQQARVQGILHDRSDTGATVFLEPAETVELGNRLRDLEIAVRQEIARLLADLTAQVAARAEELRRDLRIAAVLDMATAKARLAERMQAHRPSLRNDGYLELRRARHPLLTGEVVPNDVWIGRDFTTLVITGPNTGGKTVLLKTVGLLTLMAQAGLHIPAGPTSQVNIFDHVFADIGDEQSIEQSLSTFSSHMTHIVRIVNQVAARRREKRSSPGAGPDAEDSQESASGKETGQGAGARVNALVLLDEIGAGTDPAEGSALARALLEELHEAGCRTIATTHYNELKTFAYQRKGMENASVEFDDKTLAPTYRLLIGHAGASNALAVAQRLGLPRRIVALARRLLGRRGREVDEALRAIERSRRRLEDQLREAEDLRAQLERLRAQHERELARLEEERKRLAQRGYERARQIVAAAEEEARRIIAELQRQPRQSKITQRLREELAELSARIEADGRELLRVETGAAQRPLPFRAGDWVRIRSSGSEGEIEQVGADEAVVRVGKLAVKAPLSDLEPAGEPSVSAEATLAQKIRSKKALSVPTEIHLLGMRVDEAIHVLEKFLDDAFLAGHPQVRIVHGKGTGALRQAIHEWLREQPMVRGFTLASPSEGGSGVTIVEL